MKRDNTYVRFTSVVIFLLNISLPVSPGTSFVYSVHFDWPFDDTCKVKEDDSELRLILMESFERLPNSRNMRIKIKRGNDEPRRKKNETHLRVNEHKLSVFDDGPKATTRGPLFQDETFRTVTTCACASQPYNNAKCTSCNKPNNKSMHCDARGRAK